DAIAVGAGCEQGEVAAAHGIGVGPDHRIPGERDRHRSRATRRHAGDRGRLAMHGFERLTITGIPRSVAVLILLTRVRLEGAVVADVPVVVAVVVHLLWVVRARAVVRAPAGQVAVGIRSRRTVVAG